MSEIRLLAETEIEAYTHLFAAAYPGIHRPFEQLYEDFLATFHQSHGHFLGLFKEERMLGGMIHYDFKMTLLDRPVTVGGLGGVAVHLFHKKQRVAYRLVQHFLRRCGAQAQPLALLYPFRPNFYWRMGFGYGTKVNQYRIEPTGLPRTGSIEHLRFAGPGDRDALLACYNRYATVTNGMILHPAPDFDSLLQNQQMRCLAYAEDEAIRGYLLYRFRSSEPPSFLNNDLHVRELVYETPAALAELLVFLHLQLDQAARIVINTQDEFFTHLLGEPRNGSNRPHETNTQGISWMPRVVDVPGVFAALADHNFNGQSVRLRIDLADDFLPENESKTVVWFDRGAAQVAPGGEADVTLRIHVRDFSSLIMGVVHLRWLASVGLAVVDPPEQLEAVHRLFAWDQKPICLTSF